MFDEDALYPVTYKEFLKRLRFIRACCEDFKKEMRIDSKGVDVFYPDDVPGFLTIAHFKQANIVRKELTEGGLLAARDSRHRIDRHKIAACLVSVIRALQPMEKAPSHRNISNNMTSEHINASFAVFVVTTLFNKWHAKRLFNKTGSRRFLKEHLQLLKHHAGDIPHHLLSQAYYLLERMCLVEIDRAETACRKVPCEDRIRYNE